MFSMVQIWVGPIRVTVGIPSLEWSKPMSSDLEGSVFRMFPHLGVNNICATSGTIL